MVPPRNGDRVAGKRLLIDVIPGEISNALSPTGVSGVSTDLQDIAVGLLDSPLVLVVARADRQRRQQQDLR